MSIPGHVDRADHGAGTVEKVVSGEGDGTSAGAVRIGWRSLHAAGSDAAPFTAVAIGHWSRGHWRTVGPEYFQVTHHGSAPHLSEGRASCKRRCRLIEHGEHGDAPRGIGRVDGGWQETLERSWRKRRSLSRS